MKILLFFILFILTFITIESKNVSKEISFDKCNKDSWWMKNISLTPSGSLINFEANITPGEKNINSTSVKFTLTGCSSNFTCLNHTDLSIEGLNCTNNSTDAEKELCSILKVIEDWTKNSTHLMALNDKKPKEACIPYESEGIEARSDSKTNASKIQPTLESLLSNETLIKPF